jgi:hypothetical protein
MQRVGSSIGALVILVSCSSSPTVPSVEPYGEFLLQVGSAAQVSGTGLRVQFERVLSDSRCPEGALCIRAGDAEVAVTVTRQGRSKEVLSLRTVGADSRALLGDWALSLTKLEPYPETGRSIPPRDYEATFRVDPLALPAGP